MGRSFFEFASGTALLKKFDLALHFFIDYPIIPDAQVHDDEAGKDLKCNVAGEHIGEQSHTMRDGPRQERQHLDRTIAGRTNFGTPFSTKTLRKRRPFFQNP
jgi:hypothetical protein